mmetsp:Transcript_34967/g.62948  ORF Transcript_34967/g.62948 Transcript_34967/m.62948 type:complete len:133 (-) Transcript_34967:539-937(-)
MVALNTSTLAITPPTTRWVVLLSKILLVVIILSLLPEMVRAKPKKRKNRSLEKVYNGKVVRCETGECGHHILEESMNCVTECVSRKCHIEASFDVDPLEDGEIDEGRAILFAQCVKNEILREKYNARAALKR